jgi:hypothetical protein
MSQFVTDINGQVHSFPDGATLEQMKWTPDLGPAA